MHAAYTDIRELAPDTEPSWYDEHGVPRYREFSPDRVAAPYAEQVALILVACQECGKLYPVVISFGPADKMQAAQHIFVGELLAWPQDKTTTGAELSELHSKAFAHAWDRSLAARVLTRSIFYGDPPNGCDDDCAAGTVISSIPKKVLEFWTRGLTFTWVRVPALEIELEADRVAELAIQRGIKSIEDGSEQA